MEKINLSEPDGTRQRWVDGAIRESAALGRAVSISEYVRRAVEAYQHGNGKGEGAASPSGGVLRATGKRDGMGGDEQAPRQDIGIVDSRIVGVGGRVEGDSGRGEGSGGAVKREAKAPQQRESDHAAPPSLPLRSVPKELQTRRRKK